MSQWHGKSIDHHDHGGTQHIADEVVNIEYWGGSRPENPADILTRRTTNNSYKTVRIIDQENSWYFAKWCNASIDTELYNTKAKSHA